MKILDSKVIPNGYTGCILMGKNRYAYFDDIAPTDWSSLVKFPGSKDSTFQLLNDSIQEFVSEDCAEYCRSTNRYPYSNYYVTLEYYSGDKNKFKVNFHLNDNLLIWNTQPSDVLLTGLIYFLSSLANYQNLKVEYIKYNPGWEFPPTVFCGTRKCSLDYAHDNKAGLGISFDTPINLKTIRRERTIIYAIIYDNPYGNVLNITTYALSGRIINVGTAVNVFQVQDGKPIIVHKLDGISEFNFEGIQELPLITSDDIIE